VKFATGGKGGDLGSTPVTKKEFHKNMGSDMMIKYYPRTRNVTMVNGRECVEEEGTVITTGEHGDHLREP
jgi:hypothetical protein